MRASRSLVAGIALLFLTAPVFAKSRCVRPEHRADSGAEADVDVEDALLREAQMAYVNGEFTRAIELAKPLRGPADSPRTRAGRIPTASARTRGWRITGAAACNLRDLKLARDAYRHLDPNARQFIIYVCQRTGVGFTGGAFRVDAVEDAPGRDVAPDSDVPSERDITPDRYVAPVGDVDMDRRVAPGADPVPGAGASPAPPSTARSLGAWALFVVPPLLLGALLVLLLRRRGTLSSPPP